MSVRTPEEVAAEWGKDNTAPFISCRPAIKKLIESRDAEILKELGSLFEGPHFGGLSPFGKELLLRLFHRDPPVPSLSIEDRISRLEELAVNTEAQRRYDLGTQIAFEVASRRHMEPKK